MEQLLFQVWNLLFLRMLQIPLSATKTQQGLIMAL